MKGTSLDLFRLIHALDRREKGYVFGRLKEHDPPAPGTDPASLSNNCLLFKAFDRLKEPDESLLLSELQGHSVVGYLSRAKTYLYQSILKVLRDYQANKNRELKRLRELEDVVVLYHLGLPDQAHKKLERLQKHSAELPAYLGLGIAYQQLLLMQFTNALENSDGVRESMRQLEARISQEREMMGALAGMQSQLFDRKNSVGHESFSGELPDIPPFDAARSDLVLDQQYRAQTLKSYLTGNVPDFDRYSSERLEALQGSRLYEMYPILYLNAVNNRLDYLYLHSHDWKEAAGLLEMLQGIRSSKFVEARVAFRKLLFEIKSILFRPDPEPLARADTAFANLIKDLPQLSFNSEQGNINILLGIGHAITGDLKQSNDRLQKAYHNQNIGPVLLAICTCHLFINAMEGGDVGLAELFLQRINSRSMGRKLPFIIVFSKEILTPFFEGRIEMSDMDKRYHELEPQPWNYSGRAFFEEGFLAVRLMLTRRRLH